jgi:putative addiction module antidote
MYKLKVSKVGNSNALILNKEICTSLDVTEGDYLYLIKAPDGFRISPYDPQFERQMAVARKVMKKRRALLRELAK